jgi:YHS domain-containing protein
MLIRDFLPFTASSIIANRLRSFKPPAAEATATAMVEPKVEVSERKSQEEPMATVKDLVCGMEIDPKTAAGKLDHKGKTYYFCALSCRDKFKADPEKYIKKG